ncbi:MAG: hypothetical protein ACLFSP_11020 [Spirochaetaceae bacterium]
MKTKTIISAVASIALIAVALVTVAGAFGLLPAVDGGGTEVDGGETRTGAGSEAAAGGDTPQATPGSQGGPGTESGQTQLAAEQHLFHIVGVPPGEQALTGDAALTGFLLFEEVERDVAQDSEVLRGIVLTLGAFVFTEGEVKDLVQRVFNAPMPAHQMSELPGIGGKTRDVVQVARAGVFADGAL